MSLLSPERIRIGLGASYAVLARVRGNRVTDWRMQSWQSPAPSSPPWQQALNAISGWLAELAPRGGRVAVALSCELAPLHLLPWRDDAALAEQQALLAAAHFRSVYGDAVENWDISVQPTGYGRPWVGSATDRRLLPALSEQLHAAGVRLVSAMPLAISLSRALRNRLDEPACWLLVPETRLVSALHFRDGQWSLSRALPLTALQQESTALVLQRETRLAGLPDMAPKICLATAGPGSAPFDRGCVALDPGWTQDLGEPSNRPLHLLGGRQ